VVQKAITFKYGWEKGTVKMCIFTDRNEEGPESGRKFNKKPLDPTPAGSRTLVEF
jgi:hypothetical protein